MRQDDVLSRIRQTLPGMRRSEALVGSAVLEEPEAVVEMSIGMLAQKSGVSVASVARFCKGLETSGYAELRRQLAVALSVENAELGRFGVSDTDIHAKDDARDVVGKIVFHETHAIQATAAELDLDELDTVADAIVAAPRVDMYGAAASSLAGIDLQQKLHRLAIASFQWSDPHLAFTSATGLAPGSVAIAFSHSGLTMETAHALAIAKEVGATTVAITNYPDSPLGRAADHVFTTIARETRYRSGAIAGRMAQLAIVDFLFVRVAQRAPEAVIGASGTRYDIVLAHRLAVDDDLSSPYPSDALD